MPDALTGLLTATPYSYTVSALEGSTPGGNRFDEAAVRREAYNFYFLDTWKATSRLSINYGLRYEVNSRIKEAKNRTSVIQPIGPDGKPTPPSLLPAQRKFTSTIRSPCIRWMRRAGGRVSPSITR